jgi:uncharacterized protein (DUF2147 family)
MRTLKVLGLVAMVSIAGSAAAQADAPAAGPIAGRWRTSTNDAIITIAACPARATAMCGHVTRMLIPEPTGGIRDGNNPNRALRNRPVVGIEVFTNLVRDEGAWAGRGYSPEEGRNFNATLTPLTGGRLRVRGCVAVFCRTMVWTRAS